MSHAAATPVPVEPVTETAPQVAPVEVPTENVTTPAPEDPKPKGAVREQKLEEWGGVNSPSLGLLPTVTYKYNDEGLIDWTAMLKPDHFFPNRYNFEKRGEKVPKTADGLEDCDKLVGLFGLKSVARIRGYESVEFSTPKLENGYVTVKCRIVWVPNFENPKGLMVEEVANATSTNVGLMVKPYLETVAANRAFSRAVRNSLHIRIVSEEEVGEISEEAQDENGAPKTLSPVGVLMEYAKERKVNNFEELKAKIISLSKDEELVERVKNLTSENELTPPETRKIKAFLRNSV